MNKRDLTKLSLSRISLMATFGLTSIMGYAAPGILSDAPLFLGTSVNANILFIIDDSGSMDGEVVRPKEARAAFPDYADSSYLSWVPDDDEEWLEHCSAYNAMAYDPSKTYSRWLGVDVDGNTYTDKTLTTALENPYGTFSSSGSVSSPTTIDLTKLVVDHSLVPAFYVEWKDLDGDGAYDKGECFNWDSTGNIKYDSSGNPVATSGVVYVDTLSSTADRQNFANWFTYYRKREYVVKRAMSQIMDESSARMGLAALNNNNKIGTQVESIDNITDPSNATTTARKKLIMKNLFRSYPNGGTPMRGTLSNAGEYFDTTKTPDASLFGFTPTHSSPILSETEGGACQQNYAVLMTDGYWNGTISSSGNHDGDNNSKWDGKPYADTYSNTLADVAMKYYELDLAPSLPDVVPIISGVDENSAQHMVTFSVAFAVEGWSTDEELQEMREGTRDWVEPRSSVEYQTTTIDDLAHAAYNSRGEYLNAETPDELISELNRAINAIADREGSAASVAFSSSSLQTDTKVYQARFNSGKWYGDLNAYKVTSTGIGAKTWTKSAGDQLADMDYTKREIITYNGKQGIPFRWPSSHTSLGVADLSSAQVKDLLTNPSAPLLTTSDEASYGAKVVEHLRGDFSEDGILFRDRDVSTTATAGTNYKRLGDIVYSSPKFVGVAGESYSDKFEADKFSDFITSSRTRKAMVYVGANDGMLHGFDADTGAEVFSYIPGFLFSTDTYEGLHYLADDAYSYQPYVDGSPEAASVYIDGAWRTFLVGGARAGGAGIFVLDVTKPTTFSETNADNIVRFEFTNTDDPDLGYTFSKPVIAKMNNGKWAAIIGNGYNAHGGDGTAKVFVIYLDGSGYKELETKVGSNSGLNCLASASDCNGMGTPSVVDITGDDVADRIYAGDLKGNLWVFDVTDSSATNWGSAYGTTSSPKALFITPGRPITGKPSVALHPTRFSSKTDPNLMVYFGTGQYMAEGDNLTTATNAFYGVWDNGQISEITQSELQEQVITSTASGAYTVRTITDNTVDYDIKASAGALELGWYEELPDTGERSVSTSFVVNGVVFYNTLVPSSAMCSFGGEGYLMAVDMKTGGLPDNPVFDYNKDGIYDDVGGVKVGSIPAESGFISGRQLTQLSSGDVDFQVLYPAGELSVRGTSFAIDPK